MQFKNFNDFRKLKIFLEERYSERKSSYAVRNDLLQSRLGARVLTKDYGNRLEGLSGLLIRTILREEKDENNWPTIQRYLEKQALEDFIDGLRDELRLIVKARNVRNLDEAIREAVEEEKLIFNHRARNERQKENYKGNFQDQGAGPQKYKPVRCTFCNFQGHLEKDYIR